MSKIVEEYILIINILGTIDDKIENNEEIIKNLIVLQTAEYKKLVLDGKSVCLSQICKQITERLKQRAASVYSVVNIGELIKQDSVFNKRVHSEDMAGYKVIRKFDFAYNPSRINIGSIAMFEDSFGAVSPIYVVFNVERKYAYLLKEYIKTKAFNEEIIKKASGSVRQAVNYDVFAKFKMLIVDDKELFSFNSWYIEVVEQINRLRYENQKLKDLKRLYQELFFG